MLDTLAVEEGTCDSPETYICLLRILSLIYIIRVNIREQIGEMLV